MGPTLSGDPGSPSTSSPGFTFTNPPASLRRPRPGPFPHHRGTSPPGSPAPAPGRSLEGPTMPPRDGSIASSAHCFVFHMAVGLPGDVLDAADPSVGSPCGPGSCRPAQSGDAYDLVHVGLGGSGSTRMKPPRSRRLHLCSIQPQVLVLGNRPRADRHPITSSTCSFRGVQEDQPHPRLRVLGGLAPSPQLHLHPRFRFRPSSRSLRSPVLQGRTRFQRLG